MSGFLHGVEIIELNNGVRPIPTVRSAVIGLVGSAPKGPINKPTLIAGSRVEAAQFGTGLGTIPDAIDGIFDQAGALVVVINVLDPAVHKTAVAGIDYTFAIDETLEVINDNILNVVVKDQTLVATYVEGTDYSVDVDTGIITRITTGTITAGETVNVAYDRIDETLVTTADIMGGVDVDTGARTGVHALLDAESDVGVQPKVLIAPGYTSQVTRTASVITGAPVTSEMVSIADQLRAVILADGPNTNDADALDYRGLFGSERVFVTDPWVKVWDTDANAEAVTSNSDRVAGLIASNDASNGFWTSPSNKEINGIIGTARAIDFTLGDANARANLLNEKEVATIISKDGYRLWGNRTCSADPKWAFLAHVRLNDMILESLLRAHMWAVDRNITKTYAEDVSEGVNAYLAKLMGDGAISGGKCWLNPELNTDVTMDAGQVYFDFDYGRYGVAERVSFRAAVNNDYTVEAVFGS